MSQTMVEKIAQSHMTEGPNRLLRAGDFLSVRPYHVMTHDNTAAVMKKFRAIGAERVYDSKQPVFTADHDIQNTEESNLARYRSMQKFARDHGIDFYPPGAGIGHQIMVEDGYVLPGTFVVASDSHSNMYGALGAIGTPVVRTDAAAIWATGEFWWQIPRSIQVVLEGRLASGVTGKDVIITLCGLYNHEEVLNAAVEFTGPGVASLTMDARLSIANMSTEWGALVGWFPVDEVSLTYLESRNRELRAQGITRIPEDKLAEWRTNPPAPDPHASYSARIVLNLAEVTHRASRAIGRRHCDEEDRYTKGVPRILRELAAGGSRSGGQRTSRQEDRLRREVLPGSGERFHTAGSDQARHMADVARRRRASIATGLRAMHRSWHRSA
jgi:homoaconitate hydratase